MKRHAFTLVELLIVIVVIGLLAAMTTAAVSGVTNTAKVARTRAIVSLINDVLMTKYESYRTRPLPVAVPDFTPDFSDLTTTVDIEVAPREAARARLLMIRDLMRMEMPDRKVDITDPPTRIDVAAVNVLHDLASNTLRPTGGVVKRQVTWFDSSGILADNVPAQLAAYRDRVPLPDLAANPSAGRYDAWSRQWESAEALYLIMSTTFVDGTLAIEGIPSANIDDVDEDGMPEIVDSWGTPIGFIRWPVDYVDSSNFTLTDDELDPFKVDFGFVAANAPPISNVLPSGSTTRTAPFSMRPLVVSAGPDRVFDLRFTFSDPGSDINGVNDIHFGKMTWPQSVMGADSAGHDPPYYYIDPYQRQFSSSTGYLGAYYDEDGDGDEQRADNITNFQLEATQ